MTPVGGNDEHARRSRPRRENPLHRLLEFLRLAPDEIAGRIADRYGWPRYVAHQAYYSLVGRDYEWELMPLGFDQKVGAVVWSPLGWGRLTGKLSPRAAEPEKSRALQEPAEVTLARRCRTSISIRWSMRSTKSRGKPARPSPQIALNWLLQRPTVSTVIIGARNEEQLRAEYRRLGWKLTPEQVAKLDAASAVPLLPVLAPEGFAERNPFPTA